MRAKPDSRSISTYAFAGVVLGILGVLIVPLPPPVLDALFAIDLLFAGIVLITSIVIREPIDFAAFAPLLLIATLFRLSLDVSATRLILSHGHIAGAVGEFIPAFGNFVIQGNVVVGLIIFAILTTIQFAVIASGAGRVAEVAARFTLDALPGKQMAIDAELHAGAIDAATAKVRRRRVAREADFFGAMDGAGKFVKGDAVAALVITVFNVAGGIAIGMGGHGLAFGDAVQSYVMYSVGNALLTTLPSFLLSVSMGLLVTRVAADDSLGADVANQVFGRPAVLRAAAVFALALACVPALPHVVFVVLAIAAFLAAGATAKREASDAVAREAAEERDRRGAMRRPEAALARVGVDPVTICFGRGLLTLCDAENGESLLDRISELRRVMAAELGFILPGVRLRDALDQEENEYRVYLRGELVGRGRLVPDRLLVIGPVPALEALGGDMTVDPIYGIPACSVPQERRAELLETDFLLFDAISLIGSHIAELARAHAAKLVGRQEVQTLLEHLRFAAPAVVKDLTGDRIGMHNILRVYVELLEERVWPKDVLGVFEMMLDGFAAGEDERAITARIRARLVPGQFARAGTVEINPLVLDPALEGRLRDAWHGGGGAPADPRMLGALRAEIEAYVRATTRAAAAIVCTGAIRREMAKFIARLSLDVPVYAFGEIPNDVRLRPACVAVAALPA